MATQSTKLTGTFASGISSPFRSDSDGGLALAEGEAYVEQLVLTALQVNESDNPFQDLGVTNYAVFKPSADPAWRLVMRRRIRTQMELLERDNLAKFVRIDFGGSDGNGNFTVEVTYLNLETQQENTFTAAITPNGSVNLRAV